MAAEHSTSDLVGEPVTASGGQAGYIQAIEPGPQQRAILQTSEGPVNVALERVEKEKRIEGIRRIVKRLCDEPDADGARATLASYPSVIGKCNGLGMGSRDEIEDLIRSAIHAGAIVEWSTEDGRWFVPCEEQLLKNVIAEQNRSENPETPLIEHCADVISREVVR